MPLSSVRIIVNQYNKALERMLPMNGIEFIEISRIKIGDKVISASEARRLLKEKMDGA